MKKRVTLWSILILALVAGGAYSQGTLIKRFIGSQDVNWAQGGSGAREVFTYTTPQGYVLTLNKPDATDIKYRAVGAGSVEGSATADIVPEIQSYASLSAAVTAIGSNPATIKLLPGIYPVTSPLTISGNISIKPERGAILNANNAALTIQGPIAAGPYQIFSWTGTGSINLTGSPTSKIPFQWFGAVTGTSTDNAAALVMAASALGSQQDLYLPGLFALKTPVSITNDPCFGIVGDDPVACGLWINVGSTNTGLTFTGGDVRLDKVGIIGPANCCQYGLYLNGSTLRFGIVNMYLGSTSYALKLNNNIYGYVQKLDFGHYNAYYTPLGAVRPHDAIYLGTPTAGCNSLDMNVNISGGQYTDITNGIYIDGSSDNVRVTGSIEGCVNPFTVAGTDQVANRPKGLTIESLTLGDANTNGYIIDAVNDLSILGGNAYGLSTFNRVRHGSLISTAFSALTVNADCSGMSYQNVSVDNYDDFKNYAQSAAFLNPVRITSQADAANPGASPTTNYCPNSAMRRWTASLPDGWVDTHGTHTKCGVGIGADTTQHFAPYCDKINTNGNDNIFPGVTIPDIAPLLGKYVSFSVWIKASAAGSALPKIYLDPTVPARANSTSYNINDYVSVTQGSPPVTYLFRCVVAGQTTNPVPTFNTDTNQRTVDGAATWVTSSIGGNYAQTAIVGSFYQISVSGIFPQNATAISTYLGLWQTAGAADVNYYVAEPCLQVGGAPVQYNYSSGEFPDYVGIGAMKQVQDAYVPSSSSSKYYSGHYFRLGDVCWNNGTVTAISTNRFWMCTTAGAPGSWAAY